ncbi:MAG: hypothetical protein IJX25_04450 [Clostridia bacterium]|nr:hypothetical protein [Clostridia bacterium]MBQ8792502.1 hypothetical protein [Clostridia bacterium]
MNIKETLYSVISNQEEIKRQEKLMAIKEEEYRKAVAENEEVVSTLTFANKTLLEKSISVKFVDLLNEIAKEWDCEVKDIRVSSSIGVVNCKNQKGKQIDKDSVIEAGIIQHKNVNIYLVSPNGRKSVTISQKVFGKLHHIQADGKPLIDHIQPKLNKLYSTQAVYSFDLGIDDLNTFIIEKPLGEIVYINSQNRVQPLPHAGYKKLIYKIALEQEDKQQDLENE